MFFLRVKEELRKQNIYITFSEIKQDASVLSPEEKKYIEQSCLKRQNEFISGRWCAKQTIREMGLDICCIPVGAEGEPVWPDTVCGSISHTDRVCTAALSFTRDHLSVGIDIEDLVRRISEDACHYILNPEEFAFLPDDPNQRQKMIKLIFSAKESIFKLFYPLTQHRFFFSAVSLLSLQPADNSFQFRLNKDLSPQYHKGLTFSGLYLIDDQWIFTLCALPKKNGNFE